MSSPVKVLINSMGGGGAERQVSYLLKASLIKKIFILQRDIAYDLEPEKINAMYGDNFRLNILGNLKALILGPFSFSKCIKEGETVLSFLELSNFINILSKCIKPHNAIVSVRISPSFYDNKKLGFIYKILIRFLYPFASKVITNSEECREDILNLLGTSEDHVVTIRNGLDVEKIIQLKNQDTFQEKNTTGKDFVAIGRLSYQKNYPAMIRIFSKLLKENPEHRLLIIGKGEEELSLVSIAKKLNLKVRFNLSEPGDVYFLGFQKNPYRFISRDSIFLMTSFYEGLPNVLLEAMVCGAFVVSSDCKTGPTEILFDDEWREYSSSEMKLGKNGLLLPVPKDHYSEKVWVNEINKILLRPEEISSVVNNSIKSSQRYRLDSVLGEWSDLLQ